MSASDGVVEEERNRGKFITLVLAKAIISMVDSASIGNESISAACSGVRMLDTKVKAIVSIHASW